jgi:hypothetical protein
VELKLICKKTHSEVKNTSVFNDERQLCYYHDKKVKYFDMSTLQTLVDNGHACKAIIPFLKQKIIELNKV